MAAASFPAPGTTVDDPASAGGGGLDTAAVQALIDAGELDDLDAGDITAALVAAAADATTKANAAQAAAIAAAASDATTKANSAQSAATSAAATDATSKAGTAQAAAIAAAATDATTKAGTAQTAATTAAATAATTARSKAYRGTVTALTSTAGTAETTVGTVTVPQGIAAAGDLIRVTMWGSLASNNATPTWTINLKVGGTTIATFGPTGVGANGNPRRFRATIELDLSAAAVWELLAVIDATAGGATPLSNGAQMAGAAFPTGIAMGNGTADFSAGAVAIALTSTWSTADATFAWTPKAIHAEVIKAG